MDNATKITDELRLAGAAAQARAIAQGSVDRDALAASENAAIEHLNPTLNAFVQRVEPASGSGDVAKSPLAGVSFAVKDNMDVQGLATHAGLRVFDSALATSDATAVARLKEAGLVCTGKLNMSPMALGASTHNRDFGNCFNPHGDGLSAGGSSGGSASAVAAGLVGIALGTDTMGSVRLPAALCGVVGFKPGWGRLPVDGVVPLCAMLDHVGVLSRSVEDAALAYSIMAAGSLASNQSHTQRGDQLPDGEHNAGLENVRLGLPMQGALSQLPPEVEATFESACELLATHALSLEPVDVSGVDLSRTRRAGLLLCEAELLTTLEGIYPERQDQLPPELVQLLDFISNQSVKRLGQAVASLAAARCKFETWIDGVHALVLPTCSHTAFPMSGAVPNDVADLTVIANVMGAPAISLPLPNPAGGLPIGLQLVGRYGHDEELLVLARHVETLLVRSG